MVVRWTFYDPITVETYTMQVNPNEGGTPVRKKNVNYRATTAPDGKVLVYEGRDDPVQLSWSGVILTEQHLNDLDYWFNKRRQIQLTDHLGRQYWIYLTEFNPKHIRSVSHPWKHDYDMSAIQVDWP